MRRAVTVLALAALGLGCDHRHAGPVDAHIQHVRRRRGRQHDDLAGGDRRGLRLDDGRGGLAVGLGALAGHGEPGQLAYQACSGRERHRRGRPSGHLPQPRRHARPGDAELVIAGRQPVMTLTAVIPGPADGHRAEHRVHAPGPAAGQLRLVTAAARHPRAGIPGIGGQQVFQHTSAQPDQPRPDRLLAASRPCPAATDAAAAAASRVTSAAASAASRAASSWPSRPFFAPAGQAPSHQAQLTAGAHRRSPRSPPRSDRSAP